MTSRDAPASASGTLYRHFTTKDALVGELLRLKLSEFAEHVRRKFEEESDPWAAFEGGLREQAGVMAGDAAHQGMPFAATPNAALIAAPAIEELRDAWGVVIARAKEAGVLRQDFEVDDIRTMMCGLGSMMAADARGVMSYDWQRQLDLFLGRGAYQPVVTLRAAMRRLLTIPLVLLALLIAGCGGGGDSGSALDSALSYLPKDAPFAVAIDTDLDGDQYKALQDLIKKFPFGGQLQDSLRQQLEQGSERRLQRRREAGARQPVRGRRRRRSR